MFEYGVCASMATSVSTGYAASIKSQHLKALSLCVCAYLLFVIEFVGQSIGDGLLFSR